MYHACWRSKGADRGQTHFFHAPHAPSHGSELQAIWATRRIELPWYNHDSDLSSEPLSRYGRA